MRNCSCVCALFLLLLVVLLLMFPPKMLYCGLKMLPEKNPSWSELPLPVIPPNQLVHKFGTDVTDVLLLLP